MAIPVEMPKLGNTVEECLVARWFKQPGEAVADGEVLAEIETDKATFELTAPAAGTLLGIFFEEGDLVPVFANVCVVGKPGESIEEFRPKPAASIPEAEEPSEVAVTRRHASAGTPSPEIAKTTEVSGKTSFSPRARRFAEERGLRPEKIMGTGPGGRILEADLKRLYYESPRLSSLAEKMVESGFELRGDASVAKRRIFSGDLSSPPVKISGIREKIARRMRASLAETAQYTMNTSADATGLLSLRARIKAKELQADSPSVNINDMIMFCAIRALEAVPEMNVEFLDDKIYQHSGIHIGFACDTPKGLLVPVIRDSQKLGLIELASKIKALTKQAVEGGIAPDDLSGGSFTVSNLGTYGIESFSPILNPPQVAILGVDAIGLKPVRRKGAVEFIDHIGLSLTCDHQVIDGAHGARFLKIIRETIEDVESIACIDG